MSERSKERDSRAANDFKTVWLRKAVLAHERVRSFACAMHSWVRTPLQPFFFRDLKYSNACYASVRVNGFVLREPRWKYPAKKNKIRNRDAISLVCSLVDIVDSLVDS